MKLMFLNSRSYHLQLADWCNDQTNQLLLHHIEGAAHYESAQPRTGTSFQE